MTTLLLISLYSLVIIAATLAGAFVSGRVHIKHTHMQLVMSLVSGLMLGIAIFHLLPHGIQELDGTARLDSAMLWLMAGLLVMFILLRLFHFHQHDASGEDHDHQSSLDDCAHHQNEGGAVNSWAWLGAFLGLAIHTLIDGVALGAAILADSEGHGLHWAGIGVFVAILLHKPLDALTISALMKRSGQKVPAQLIIVALFALMVPAGAVSFILSASIMAEVHLVVGYALMFSTGVFLCISLSDLLPELQFHSHDRVKLTVLLGAGILAAFLITGLEPNYHGHDIHG